jgi:hypothetical protein
LAQQIPTIREKVFIVTDTDSTGSYKLSMEEAVKMIYYKIPDLLDYARKPQIQVYDGYNYIWKENIT